MKNPLVSVVIPTYNRSNTIERAIDSVLNQTYKEFEIIVVDDASKDNTSEVLSKYKYLNNFTYIQLNTNVGGAEARNIGINYAKGSYIAFQDSDDEWLPTKLTKQMEYFLNHKVDVVFSQIIRKTGSLESLFPKQNSVSINLSSLLQSNYIGTPSAVIKKDKIIEVSGFDKTLPRLQDWDLFIRLADSCKFHMISEVLCIAYLQENSITNNPQALVDTIFIFNKKYEDKLHKLTKFEQSKVFEKYGSLLMNIGKINEAKQFFKKGLKEYIFNRKLILKYILVFLGGEKAYNFVK